MNVKRALFAMLCAGAIAPLFTGCATVTRGTKEVLVVESEPSGAAVRLSNGMVGTTPTSFKIPRKGKLEVTIIKQGYETVEVNVNTQVAGAGAAGMAGNVLVGGIIGVGIDSFSGGMLEHKPNPIRVTLVPVVPLDGMLASVQAPEPPAVEPPASEPEAAESAATPDPPMEPVAPVPTNAESPEGPTS